MKLSSIKKYFFPEATSKINMRQVKNKYETEKYICIKNNTIEKFTRKWAITSGSVLL